MTGGKYRYEALDVPYGVDGQVTSTAVRAFDGERYQSIGSAENVLAITARRISETDRAMPVSNRHVVAVLVVI